MVAGLDSGKHRLPLPLDRHHTQIHDHLHAHSRHIAPIVEAPAKELVSVFPLLVIVHALAATVWTGGHLVLDLGVLPRALRAQSAAQVRAFEEVFEPLGLTALAIQVLTGLWMGWIYLPGFQGLFSPANPIGMLVGVKLLLLAGTAALALHARLRLIPNLTDANLSGLVLHIRGITALAIAFVVVGALIRLGGLL